MAWFNGSDDPGRAVRARMAEAEARSRRLAEAEEAGEGRARRPRRYRLYDKIASKISLTAINVVIAAATLLLVIALVYGIVTGAPG